MVFWSMKKQRMSLEKSKTKRKRKGIGHKYELLRPPPITAAVMTSHCLTSSIALNYELRSHANLVPRGNIDGDKPTCHRAGRIWLESPTEEEINRLPDRASSLRCSLLIANNSWRVSG